MNIIQDEDKKALAIVYDIINEDKDFFEHPVTTVRRLSANRRFRVKVVEKWTTFSTKTKESIQRSLETFFVVMLMEFSKIPDMISIIGFPLNYRLNITRIRSVRNLRRLIDEKLVVNHPEVENFVDFFKNHPPAILEEKSTWDRLDELEEQLWIEWADAEKSDFAKKLANFAPRHRVMQSGYVFRGLKLESKDFDDLFKQVTNDVIFTSPDIYTALMYTEAENWGAAAAHTTYPVILFFKVTEGTKVWCHQTYEWIFPPHRLVPISYNVIGPYEDSIQFVQVVLESN